MVALRSWKKLQNNKADQEAVYGRLHALMQPLFKMIMRGD